MWSLIFAGFVYTVILLPTTLLINYLIFNHFYKIYKKNQIIKRRSSFKLIAGDKPAKKEFKPYSKK